MFPLGPCLFQRTRIAPRPQASFMSISLLLCFTQASKVLELSAPHPAAADGAGGQHGSAQERCGTYDNPADHDARPDSTTFPLANTPRTPVVTRNGLGR